MRFDEGPNIDFEMRRTVREDQRTRSRQMGPHRISAAVRSYLASMACMNDEGEPADNNRLRPRDKARGDGIASHALAVLSSYRVTSIASSTFRSIRPVPGR